MSHAPFPSKMTTITISTALYARIMRTLGAQPIDGGLCDLYEEVHETFQKAFFEFTENENLKIKATPVATEKQLAQQSNTTTLKKRVRNRAPLPAKAMAQEFIKLNPTATRADVIKHLVSKGVSDPVASSTVGKLMKK